MNEKCEGSTEGSDQGCSCENELNPYVIPEINKDGFKRFVNEKEYDQEAHLRVYTLTTVDVIDGKIYQKGSAPNFKGDVMTLSTCKHDMRRTLYKNYWDEGEKNLWIAGFAKSTLRKKEGFSDSILLFLGKVEQIHETFYEAWNEIDEKTGLEKDASKHPLGDFYRPNKDLKEPSLKANDFKKCSNHSHGEDSFEKDVNTGLIFVFDSDKTFVFGPRGKEIDDKKHKKHFERNTGLDGYLTERNRIDRYGRKTKLRKFIKGITGG